MRILDFVVDKQLIDKSSSCDFSGLVAGTKGYLHARFCFSHEWCGYTKVAVFEVGGVEYPVIIRNGTCAIPPQVTECDYFTVSVVGKRGENILTSSRVRVIQGGV